MTKTTIDNARCVRMEVALLRCQRFFEDPRNGHPDILRLINKALKTDDGLEKEDQP